MKVVLSSAFGDYLDKRELQQAFENWVPDDHAGDAELWLDVIADTADGFDPTYTVAWCAAQRELRPEGCDRPLPRGAYVVLAGDEVYPVGSPAEYENRFMGPYKAALPWTDGTHPVMYAIPGNHDWYDGLTGFMRVFGQENWVGGRQTKQRRSYFAIGLPHRHWLWGIDIQNDAYVDSAQIAYFRRAAKLMKRDDRLILCSAKPSWTDVDDPDSYRNLEFVGRKLVPEGVDTIMMISGDSHHYAHYTNIDDEGRARAKVTAGGGGAFLSATHTLPDRVDVPKAMLGEDDPPHALERFDLVTTYPSKPQSRRLTYGALLVGWRNPTFVIIPAILNLLLFAANTAGLRPDVGAIEDVAPEWDYGDLLTGQFRGPFSVLLALTFWLLLASFYKVKQSTPRWRAFVERGIAGALHTVAHLLAFALVALTSITIVDAIGLEGAWFTIVAGLLVLVFGAVLGSLVFGAYLVIALAVFKRHANENFSASRYETYKNFLRIHIGPDGVTVYPIGIDKPCTKWKVAAQSASREDSYIAPEAGTIATRLIEPPFTV
ncbi:MAG TPA: metallophosphoesterase [Ilumatobacter sp.]|nr:metallophosphoesterase [Ilumatobacter sp.]